MSGLSPSSDFNFSTSSSASDSRLLDAAQTLVTLQSRGGANRGQSSQEKVKSVYLTPHHSNYKMPPQPPTSSGGSILCAPNAAGTVAATSNNVTFVLINQSSLGPGEQPATNSGSLMRPPVEPPPRRGRGRGRGRGASTIGSEAGSGRGRGGASVGSETGSGRGRGRGRGRGANRVQQQQVMEQRIPELDVEIREAAAGNDNDDSILDGDVGTEEKEQVVKEETFMVGDLELKDSIFDDILNKKKLELIMDPDIIALLSKSQKGSRNGAKN